VLCSRPHLDDAHWAELLDDVIAESERLDRVLSTLGWLTDITTGRLQAFPEPVLLEPLATRISREIGTPNPAHCFVLDFAPELPPAAADPTLLEGVLRQLYEHAVTSAPAGGAICTTVVPEGETIVTRITGDGVGIAPQRLSTVFEPSRSVGARGMGLGLWLCRGLIEAQGGRIEASSPGLGHGATFTVTLPLAQDRVAYARP
jgi:signal transduction histidine kinase